MATPVRSESPPPLVKPFSADPIDSLSRSPATNALLAALRPLERRFAECVAAGMTGAAAYRKAKGKQGRQDRDSSRQQAYKLLQRPHVQAALRMLLNDFGDSVSMQRGATLMQLRAVVEEAISSDSLAAWRAAGTAIMAMARIQGELSRSSPIPRISASATPSRGTIQQWIDQVVADAKRIAD